MNWLSYALGLVTWPLVALAYMFVVAVVHARTDEGIRKGLWGLAFIGALLLVGVVVGMYVAHFWAGQG